MTPAEEESEALSATLDFTKEAFHANPTNKTAGAWLKAATQYEMDEQISSEELLDVVSEILEYLEK